MQHPLVGFQAERGTVARQGELEKEQDWRGPRCKITWPWIVPIFFFLTSILQDFWVNYIYSKRNTTANASGNSPLFKELFLPWAPAPLPHPHPNHIFLGHMLNRALRNTFQTTYPRICLDSNQLLQTTSVGNFKPLCWLQPPLPSLAHSLRVRKDELR